MRNISIKKIQRENDQIKFTESSVETNILPKEECDEKKKLKTKHSNLKGEKLRDRRGEKERV